MRDEIMEEKPSFTGVAYFRLLQAPWFAVLLASLSFISLEPLRFARSLAWEGFSILLPEHSLAAILKYPFIQPQNAEI